jgi:hypothetical protein
MLLIATPTFDRFSPEVHFPDNYFDHYSFEKPYRELLTRVLLSGARNALLSCQAARRSSNCRPPPGRKYPFVLRNKFLEVGIQNEVSGNSLVYVVVVRVYHALAIAEVVNDPLHLGARLYTCSNWAHDKNRRTKAKKTFQIRKKQKTDQSRGR